MIPRYLAPPPAPGPSFYGHVYHPDFNLDSEDAEETAERFQRHLRAVGQGVQGLRGVFGKVREANVGEPPKQANYGFHTYFTFGNRDVRRTEGLIILHFVTHHLHSNRKRASFTLSSIHNVALGG